MDDTNDLMERCLQVVAGWDTTEEFRTIYSAVWPGRPAGEPNYWYVGVYVRDHGKRTADGPTLVEALRNWLEEWSGTD